MREVMNYNVLRQNKINLCHAKDELTELISISAILSFNWSLAATSITATSAELIYAVVKFQDNSCQER